MWQPLGTLTPDFNLWLPFPGDAGAGTVFRLQFISDGNIENVFSSLWLRRVWIAGTFREKEVELSQKLYPQVHSVILWLPIPPALELVGLIPLGYEIRKDYRYRKGSYAEPNWHVSLAVWPNNAVSTENVSIQLETINNELEALINKLSP